MNFGQNLYQWFLSNAQSLVLMSIVVIGIYLGFKREFSKLIGFLVVALIAVGLVFNAGGVKGKRCQRKHQGYADTDRLCGVFRKGKGKVQRVRLQAWHGAGTAVQTVGTIGKAGTA